MVGFHGCPALPIVKEMLVSTVECVCVCVAKCEKLWLGLCCTFVGLHACDGWCPTFASVCSSCVVKATRARMGALVSAAVPLGRQVVRGPSEHNRALAIGHLKP